MPTTVLEMRVLYSTVTMCLIRIANLITQLVFIDELTSFAEEILQVAIKLSFIIKYEWFMYYIMV